MKALLAAILILGAATCRAGEVRLDLKKLKSRITPVQVTIDDPLYLKKKKFDAFPISEVLKEELKSADEIVFTALDGYAPSISAKKFLAKKAFLAFRETGKKDGQFEMLKDDHMPKAISPAPFYLVWEEGAKLGTSEYQWAFQVVKYESINFQEKYARILPGEDRGSKAWRGFEVFKGNCLTCHAINKQGGVVGPELNAPKNVTEYWKEEMLKEYIPNAPAFRYGSKMPAFPQLSREDVQALLEYFKVMKSRKI